MSIKNAGELQRTTNLRKYEAAIEKGHRSLLAMGEALGRIRKEKLYEDAGFRTFDEYTEARHDISRRSADRLINAARVVLILGPIGLKIKTESVARELAALGLDTVKMSAVITAVEARTGRITAASIREVRTELYPDARVIEGELADEPIEAPERPAIEGSPPAADPLDSIPAAKRAVEKRTNQAAAEPSAAGEPTPRQSGPDSPAGPVDDGNIDGSGTQAGPGKSTADTVAGSVAGTGTADLSVPATPKDAPGMDGGEPDPVPADSPAGRDLQGPSGAPPDVANGRPETDHRDHEPGDETGPEAPSPDNASGPVAGRDPASNGFTGVRPFPVAALGKGATGGEAVGSGGDTPVLPSDPADALHAVAKLFAAIDLETYGPWQSDERIDRMSWDAQQITGAVQTIAMFQSGLTLDGPHP